MDSAKTVTATFIMAPDAKNKRTGSVNNLQDACNSLENIDNDIIKARISSTPLAGGLNLNLSNILIFIEGGYDAAFGNIQSGYTTLLGPLSVSRGAVVLDRLIIM